MCYDVDWASWGRGCGNRFGEGGGALVDGACWRDGGGDNRCFWFEECVESCGDAAPVVYRW